MTEKEFKELKPGDKVKLIIQRNYKQIEIEATLKRK